jgi:demethylmenaquinone methyltransferase/2-methoxy-6-polyprenyl-1,4-benzoquinol methylase
MRALTVFGNAGLEEITARTFVGDVQTPLEAGQRTALTSLFQMLWGAPQPGTSAEDVTEYKRLCTPGSTEFILDLPDYYAFFTYTMFSGRVPKG